MGWYMDSLTYRCFPSEIKFLLMDPHKNIYTNLSARSITLSIHRMSVVVVNVIDS